MRFKRNPIKLDIKAFDLPQFKKKRHRWPVHRPRDIISTLIASISSWIAYAVPAWAGFTAYSIAQVFVYAVVIGASLWATVSGMGGKKKGGHTFQKSLDQNGHLVNTRIPSEPVKVIYGKFKVGGNWVFSEPSRDNNQILNVVTTWGEGEVQGIVPALDYTPLFSGTGRNDLSTGGDFSYEGCTCNESCYGYGGCTCNMSCYGDTGKLSGCSCENTCYGYGGCSCDMSCYGYNAIKYKVQIDGTGTPNTFKWSDNGGTSWNATGVQITGDWQDLNNGTKIRFETTTGHTLNDSWVFWGADGVWLGERLLQYYKDYGGSDLASHYFYPGSATQNISSQLQAEVPAWEEAMRYTAYSYFKLTYHADAWASVPEMTALIRGRKLYDPRNNSTTYSANPALVWLDFLTNVRYGLGISQSMIDMDSVKEAANWCDINGYRFDGAIIDRQAFIDNLEEILSNFRAYTIWTEGRYKLKIFTDDAPVMHLTEEDVDINPQSFTINIPGIPETPAKVKLTFADKDKNYTANAAFKEDSSAISIDGDPKQLEMTLVGTVRFDQAKKLSDYYLKRNRINKEFSLLCHPRCYALEPGDMVLISHEFPGWDIGELNDSDENEIITSDENDLEVGPYSRKLRVKEIGIPQEGLIPVTFLDEEYHIYEEAA